MSSRYISQAAHGTVCPRCRKQPRLLVRDDAHVTRSAWPAFYVCACGFIGQVGVGPVEELPQDEGRSMAARVREI